MAQKISKGSIFGRVGTGIGQGLAETFPRQMEQGMLSSGLRNFADTYRDKDLTPLQTAAYLSAIPGAAQNPQLVKSFTDLALQDREMNAFRGGGPRGPAGAARPPQEMAQMQGAYPQTNTTPAPMPSAPSGVRGDIEAAQRRAVMSPDRGNVPQDTPVPPNVGIEETNPLDQRAVPRQPWTPQQRNARVAEYLDMGFQAQKAQQLASDDEVRDLKEPEAFRAQQDYLSGVQSRAREALDKDLKTKLQTNEQGLFNDLSSDMYTNLRKGMERDLRLNPDATLTNIVDKWSEKGLDLAKTQTQLDKTLAGIGPSDIFKSGDALTKLKSYQKIFSETGNQEHYFNKLKTAGFSPLSSSVIAYPTSKSAKEFVDSYKKIPVKLERRIGVAMPPSNRQVQEHARKYALDLDKHLDRNDSILAIAQDMAVKDPYFDKNIFFDELQENMDEMRLTPRQKREIAEGKEGITPYWMDFLVMPWLRRAR